MNKGLPAAPDQDLRALFVGPPCACAPYQLQICIHMCIHIRAPTVNSRRAGTPAAQPSGRDTPSWQAPTVCPYIRYNRGPPARCCCYCPVPFIENLPQSSCLLASQNWRAPRRCQDATKSSKSLPRRRRAEPSVRDQHGRLARGAVGVWVRARPRGCACVCAILGAPRRAKTRLNPRQQEPQSGTQ